MPTDRIILCYHAVSDAWPSPTAVTPADLRAQLALLRRRGYRGVTFSEAVRGRGRERVVAVTFDDAHRSVHAHAAPALAALGWPGTVFVPTALVGGREPMAWTGNEPWVELWADELACMGWAELAELAAGGWEIGSHTRTHPALPELSAADLEDELRGSREEIEARLGVRCPSVAYPYGRVDGRVVAAAREAGYETGAATLDGVPGGGDLARRRIVVGRGDTRRFRWKSQVMTRRVLAHPVAVRARAPLGADRTAR